MMVISMVVNKALVLMSLVMGLVMTSGVAVRASLYCPVGSDDDAVCVVGEMVDSWFHEAVSG